MVLLDLLHRGAEVGYVCTSEGVEVDFHARFPAGRCELIQVCSDLSDGSTRQRELRALQEALTEPIAAAARVITFDRLLPAGEWPGAARWSPAVDWLLEA